MPDVTVIVLLALVAQAHGTIGHVATSLRTSSRPFRALSSFRGQVLPIGGDSTSPWTHHRQQFHQRTALRRQSLRDSQPAMLDAPSEKSSDEASPLQDLRARNIATPENSLGVAFSRYKAALEKYPMRTRMATAFFLAIVGDVLAQEITHPSSEILVGRVVTLILVSVLYIVPMRSVFYGANDDLVARLGMQRGNWNTTMVQFTFNQLVSAPIQLFGFYGAFVLASAIANGSPTDGSVLEASVEAKISTEYMSTLLTNWKVSTLPMLANFAVVPPEWRVIFANCYDLVWTVILSILANRR